MNDEPQIEPTLEEKTAAVQQAIRSQIEMNRQIAKDMDENESRVGIASLTIMQAQQFQVLSMQLAQMAKTLAGLKQPSLFDPMGNPIIQ